MFGKSKAVLSVVKDRDEPPERGKVEYLPTSHYVLAAARTQRSPHAGRGAQEPRPTSPGRGAQADWTRWLGWENLDSMRRVILRILLFPSISAPLPPAPFTYFGMIHFSAASRCSACAAISHVISSSCAFLRPASSYAVASTYQLLPHDRICLVAVCRPVVSFLQCVSQISRVILEFASFPCLPPALRKSYETDSS